MDINDSKNNRKVLIVGVPATCVSEAICRRLEIETLEQSHPILIVSIGRERLDQELSRIEEIRALDSTLDKLKIEPLLPQKMVEFVSLKKRKKGHERPYRYHK